VEAYHHMRSWRGQGRLDFTIFFSWDSSVSIVNTPRFQTGSGVYVVSVGTRRWRDLLLVCVKSHFEECVGLYLVTSGSSAVTVTSGSSAVTTAWRVLRLRMEERPPDMQSSCEYVGQAVADSRQGAVLEHGGW
jgi:hypothetical protein